MSGTIKRCRTRYQISFTLVIMERPYTNEHCPKTKPRGELEYALARLVTPQILANRSSQPNFSTYQEHGTYPHRCWSLAASSRGKGPDPVRSREVESPTALAGCLGLPGDHSSSVSPRTPLPPSGHQRRRPIPAPLINRPHRSTEIATQCEEHSASVGEGERGVCGGCGRDAAAQTNHQRRL